VSEVLSRIQDIQSQIEQIRAGTTGAASTATSTAAEAASASAFASALSATGTSAGTSAGSSTAAALAAALGATPTTGASATTTASVDAVKGAIATGSGASGSDVVTSAEKYLGVPYVFGGEDRSGMDCSGLVQTVFKDLGVAMPRVVPDQARMGTEVASLADAQPGDLIVPKGEGHIVIYVGDGKVLHAPRPGKDVQIVDNWYSDADLSTIRRIVPATAEPAGAVSSASSALSAVSGTDMTTAALQQLIRGGALS
jgi:cell wall-associated NlpC family hydrolase